MASITQIVQQRIESQSGDILMSAQIVRCREGLAGIASFFHPRTKIVAQWIEASGGNIWIASEIVLRVEESAFEHQLMVFIAGWHDRRHRRRRHYWLPHVDTCIPSFGKSATQEVHQRIQALRGNIGI
ncbi:hypothetical protein DBA29_26810 [Xenophilus aerolatus]|nr:hypothetical protein [Xenophilus aerolatus]